MKMAKWILPLLFIAITACGQPSEQQGTQTPTAPSGKSEPTTGAYSVSDVQYGPVYHTLVDPVTGAVTTRTTWIVIARAGCVGCDMSGAFGVGIRAYINGVPRDHFYPGSQFTMALGGSPGEFSGMGSANIGIMEPGSYNLMVEVAPQPGFVGQSVAMTIPMVIN